MADHVILETSFLIDYERELARSTRGPAHAFLGQNDRLRLCITPTIAGEFAAGESMRNRDDWTRFLAPFRMLSIDPEVCWEYGHAYRYLKTNGLLIGASDLWISAVALAYEMPVVTGNLRDFQRVPRLEVISYGP